MYHTLDYISSYWTPYDWENYLKQHKVNKWIMCTNMLHSTIDTLSETTYIIINMNKFCYPRCFYLFDTALNNSKPVKF
jgi:hypothetical protein